MRVPVRSARLRLASRENIRGTPILDDNVTILVRGIQTTRALNNPGIFPVLVPTSVSSKNGELELRYVLVRGLGHGTLLID